MYILYTIVARTIRSFIQRCRCPWYSVVAASHTVLSLFIIQRCRSFPYFRCFHWWTQKDVWKSNLLSSVCASNTDTRKHLLPFPFPTPRTKHTMSHSCSTETVLFQSLVAYVSAKEEQFNRWPTRVPTALRNEAFFRTVIFAPWSKYQRSVIV